MDSKKDVDWFAFDSNCAIGHFATLATAPVHRIGFRQLSQHLRALRNYFEEMPKITDAIVNPAALARAHPSPISSDPVDSLRRGGWLDMAERGLYTYGALDDVHFPSPYLLIARP